MSLRILLIVISAVALVFGLYFLLAPDTAIAEFQVGSPEPALRLTVREIGGALISLAAIDWLCRNDRGSPALRAVLVGNVVFFLFNTGLDFTAPFPATAMWYAVTGLKIAFILALLYHLVRGTGRAAA